MEKETRIVLLTHGGWGMTLVRSLEMIMGGIDCVTEVPLEPAYTLSDYRSLVEQCLEGVSQDSLVICDLMGGTPANVGAMLGHKTGIRVFAGLCAPMLLEACMGLQNDGRIDSDAVLAAGQAACKDVVAEVVGSMQQGRG